MELILLILKIILIAFLVVLGLIILLLGIVLFVPIRYEVSGSVGDEWEVKLQGKLTYLLSIFKVLFSYEEGQFDIKLFLFGFLKKLKKEEPEDLVEEGLGAEEELSEAVTTEENAAQSPSTDKASEKKRAANTSETSSKTKSEAKQQAKTKNQKKEKTEQKESKFNFAFIKQQLTDEHNKSVVRKIWSELGYLLKHFKFCKIETDLVFATGDPATTGQVLGILCMIPWLYWYQFKVVPDFEAEEAYIKGTFFVAGKVRLIHLLMALLRLIFDKEVRLVVKRIIKLLEK